ncbi:DoxX [Hartmannibacter diazotrophicus]|uniref:DoxX n=1 Tax=Hartmannibacter diazotrophicus TaxID=1482074 RepID=A0A2C9DBG9_9HYPH|nr:DoxX family protein [Hartmannibacter diazotrophicus]SON57606.1 DoxX [Hartmannibacter diazotrophicus]
MKQATIDDRFMTSRLAPYLVAIIGIFEKIPPSLYLTLGRIVLAAVFFMSGQTKVEGFHLKDSTFYLFENEYALPLIPPVIAAYMATIAEHLLSFLLFIGLGARFAALGLFIMTAVIEIFVYPNEWVIHGLWATGLLVIMAKGAGVLSIDHLLRRRFGQIVD